VAVVEDQVIVLKSWSLCDKDLKYNLEGAER